MSHSRRSTSRGSLGKHVERPFPAYRSMSASRTARAVTAAKRKSCRGWVNHAAAGFTTPCPAPMRCTADEIANGVWNKDHAVEIADVDASSSELVATIARSSPFLSLCSTSRRSSRESDHGVNRPAAWLVLVDETRELLGGRGCW